MKRTKLQQVKKSLMTARELNELLRNSETLLRAENVRLGNQLRGITDYRDRLQRENHDLLDHLHQRDRNISALVAALTVQHFGPEPASVNQQATTLKHNDPILTNHSTPQGDENVSNRSI